MSKRLPTQKIILRTLYVAGAVSLALVAPNAVKILQELDPDFRKRRRVRENLIQALGRLERAHLVHISGKGKGRRVEITPKGKKILESSLVNGYRIREPFMWDRKWRVVLFDIPEKKRHIRRMLRMYLGRANFLRLQDSAWIHPYPADEFVVLLRKYLQRSRADIQYMTVDFFDSDQSLRRHFELPL